MNQPDPASHDSQPPQAGTPVPPYHPATPGDAVPALSYGPPPPTPPRGGGSAWKWVVGILAALIILGLLSCCGMFSLFGTLSSDSSSTFGETIAVIHVDGVIAGSGSSLDGIISPEEFLAYLDMAAADDNVKAVLLRVDSPGGTVAASQEIATEVARLSELKPVVVSIGDVGASGAYMIASQCDEIWAQPTSAVGSIGVITEIPNVAGLLEKVGVEFTVLTAGEYKDAGSPYRSLTASETAMIQMEVDIAYDEFINIVAEGRDMKESEVREMATGWAWSGRKAQEMGLIDELGTYNDALDAAADLGGIQGDYDVVAYDVYDYTDLLYSLIGLSRQLDPLSSLSLDGHSLPRSVPR